MVQMLHVIGKWFDGHSKTAVDFLEAVVPRALSLWVLVFFLLIAAKLAVTVSSVGRWYDMAPMALPFLLAMGAPIAGYRVAQAAFPEGILAAQPVIRLCRYGRWRDLDPLSARDDAAFGPAGLMASLAAGLLLNVPFRTVEFMLSMPAIPVHSPAWASTMMAMMTLDLVTMSFLYMVCFVFALRAVPWFPRLLVLAWVLDLCLQLAIARQVAAQPMLPDGVAAALGGLLYGNIQKVLISAALWLPYLILSKRVNVTYRRRVRC